MNDSAQGAATRALAAQVLSTVLDEGRNLEHAFAMHGIPDLEPRNRAFVKALAFGTLRTHLHNAAIISQLLDKGLRRKDKVIYSLLSVALYELINTATPDYAVVSAAVNATRKLQRPALRGLVNALLRRFLRERQTLLDQAASDESARLNYPQWFIDAVRHDWPDDWPAILASGNQQAPLWLRINLARISRDEYIQRLAAAGIGVSATPAHIPTAVCLQEAVPVADLPGFAAGDCSVQDAASQLAAIVLDANSGMRVLDACAAPGGKTCHILEHAGGDLDVVALDSNAERLVRVEQNLERLQLTAQVTAGDALSPDGWANGALFDRILIDAPCSATGVIRRHPDIRYLRRASDIESLYGIQTRMLRALWPLIKPGGRVLYSTCSVLHAENEAVVAGFLAQEASAHALQLDATGWGAAAAPTTNGLQLLPGVQETDGFFYALMERRSD